MSTHAPTPWTVERDVCDFMIYGNNHNCVCDVSERLGETAEEVEANAALIVRAVNNHERLVAACRAAEDALHKDDGVQARLALQAIREALAGLET